MAQINSFRDLIVYQRAYKLAMEIYSKLMSGYDYDSIFFCFLFVWALRPFSAQFLPIQDRKETCHWKQCTAPFNE